MQLVEHFRPKIPGGEPVARSQRLSSHWEPCQQQPIPFSTSYSWALSTRPTLCASPQAATRMRPNGWRQTMAFGWVALVQGELLPMRTHAKAFLSDVEARPDSPEAGVAYRAAGVTHWFAGEYREAREHLERALAIFQPGRDDELSFRFAHDPIVASLGQLALASWPLGDVERAVSLVGRLQARIAVVPHVASQATGRFYATVFELMCGDLSRAAPHATELARLAREHDSTIVASIRDVSRGRGGRPKQRGRRARGHAPRRRTVARTKRPGIRRAHQDCAR